MRLRILGLFVFVLIGVGLLANSHTGAIATIEPEVISRIRNRCVENQAALNRLHQTDAFLRNDRGNLYRTIIDKLMVPLNQRLASNQLDGDDLLSITADYNTQYTKFYNTYIEYDNALSKVLEIDCSKQPVAFYNALLDARAKRNELSKINNEIKSLVKRYGEAFASFKENFGKDN